MKVYTNKDLYKLKQTATTLFKENYFSAYDADVQSMLCTLLAFVAEYEARTGQQLDFKLEDRQTPQSVDEL